MDARSIIESIVAEGVFDDVAKAWEGQAAPGDIKRVIGRFKTLKTLNALQGLDADITVWPRKPFSEFQSWILDKEQKREQKRVKISAASDVEKVYEDDNVLVIAPNTWEASKKYGAGTKWCVSAARTRVHWDLYTEKDKIYFVLRKDLPASDPNYKVAVVVSPGSVNKTYYNAEDNVVSAEALDGLVDTSIFTNSVKILTKTWLANFKHTVNPDGSVDIAGNVDLSHLGLTTIAGGIKIRRVTGTFDCSHNQLTSLQGVPQKVGSFYCSNNRLTSLQGAPQEVAGDFYCSANQLTSLQGAPQQVGQNFSCYNNKLTSLQGAPQKVGGKFSCSANQLTSLQGAPQQVGEFSCYNNKLTSLQGAPQKVAGSFDCSNNRLTSLQGAPREVEGIFDCSDNKLTSLQGAPQKVGGKFFSDTNAR